MPANAPIPGEHLALPAGLRLGEFEIRSVLGGGGFGIVYRAWDHVLEREVAIKEYMPTSLATRSATHHVTMVSGSQAETFATGLRSFVNEAKLLARFEHPSLVKVLRFWEQHGTAYMAMLYYKGQTLKALRKGSAQVPEEAWLRRLCEAILGALEAMHREGVYHRDISPDNIVFDDDQRPVLLDFGAARRDISGSGQGLTAILKPSYAPIEQYGEAGGLRQGPWTDLYALGATLHFMVTGHPPPPATARALSDERPPLAHQQHGRLSREFLALVDWMLAPRPERRPQDVAQVRGALAGRVDIPMPAAPAPEPADSSDWPATELFQPEPRTQPAPARPPADDEDDPDATIVRPSNWRPSGWAPADPAQLPTAPAPAPAAAVAMPTPPPPPPPPPAPAPARPVAPPTPTPTPVLPPSPAPQVAPKPRSAAKALAPQPPSPQEREPARASRLPWLLGTAGVLLAGLVVVLTLGREAPPAGAVAPPLALPASSAAPAGSAAMAAAEPAPASSAVTVIGAPASAAAPVPAAPAPEAAVVVASPAAPATTPAASAPTPVAAKAPAVAAAKPPRQAASRPAALPRNVPAAQAATDTAPAPVAEAPAPQPTPRASVAQPAQPPERRDPNEACAGRVLVALHRCLLRECGRPEFTQHPACARARAIEQRTQEATTY